MTFTAKKVPMDEWESILLPITISNLKFENDLEYLPSDTVIEVWRDNSYKLTGRISGNSFYSLTYDRHQFISKGNIIVNENILGKDTNGYDVILYGCVIGNLIDNTQKYIKGYSSLEAELIFDSIKLHTSLNLNTDNDLRRFDWFISSKINVFFNGSTFRKYQEPHIKAKISIDKYNDEISNYIGSETSADYTQVKLENFNCIIAKVPKRYLTGSFDGICFEFRGNNVGKTTANFVRNLKYFTSFLLGVKLNSIGYTITNGEKVIEYFLTTPKLSSRYHTSLPPVPFTMHHPWGKFWLQLDKLLPKYLELEEKLQLNQSMSRFWTARDMEVGTNLPILASGLEILVSNYLKVTDNNQQHYMPQEAYLELLGQEFQIIKDRLLEVDGGKIIVDKILKEFQIGSGEKIRIFFSLLNLSLGKDEKSALALRNKMAHAARDYSEDDRAYDDLVLSHVYEMLFNRTILKLLGYNDFYRDYSQKDIPVKHISLSAGAK